MLISLIMCTQIVYISAQVSYEPPDIDSQQLWHSYTYNSGTGNREELSFSRVGLNKNFASAHGVFMWQNLQINDEIVIIGLGSNFLLVTTYNKQNDSYTYTEEIQSPAKSISMFEKWDAKTQEIKHFVLVALETDKHSSVLKWYQILDRKLKFLWDWSFHRNITFVEVIKLNYESKLLIVSHQNKSAESPSADIYSFSVHSILDIWLFEKIVLIDIPSSVSVFTSNDNTFLCASFPSTETVEIFKYSRASCSKTSDQKHFISHQKIQSFGLKSLVSFRASFRHYLAVASKHSTIYTLRDDFFFYPINGINLGSQNNWLTIPIDTYREDIMLLSDSSSDVFIITWAGEANLQVVGSFVQLACGEDIDCLEKMNRVSLKKSTAFYYDDYQYVIISTENGNPLLFKLLVKLRPLPDKVILRLNELLKNKIAIEEKYKSQKKQIEKFNALLNVTFEEDLNNRTSKKIFISSPDNINNTVEIKSQIKNSTEILSYLDNLKTKLNSLTHNVTEFTKNLLQFNDSFSHEQTLGDFLPKNISSGITFTGNVFIKNLNANTLNGYNIDNMFKNTFRKNMNKKIRGTKTLKNLKVENIVFEKIKETPACDVIFSDDLWEGSNQTIFGDLVWENKLEINDGVRILPGNKINESFEIPTHQKSFENLNFKELEITEETYIQGTINNQPFILPAHNGHFNIHYLDVVNQAMVELVNVKENLNVDFINGKNFSQILEKLLSGQSPPHDFYKIDGVFKTKGLHVDSLNFFPLLDKVKSPESRKEVIESVYNVTKLKRNSKSSNSEGRKRSILVFQNVDVNGIMFTKSLNNVSWSDLKDIVKKEERNVTFNSIKTFQKSVKSNKIVIKGPLNGRFVDNVLTTYSNQIIKFSHVFDKIDFVNISVDGMWDGIYFKDLIKSIVRLSTTNPFPTNLTFKGECYLFTENLNVTNILNNVNVQKKKVYDDDLKKLAFNNSGVLKFVKASSALLYGNLTSNDNINNVNLTEIDERRVSIHSPEILQKNITEDNFTITGNLNLVTLNNNDISSIINSGGDTKLIDKFLDGKISKIKKLLVKGNLTTIHGVNGYNIKEIFQKGISTKKPNSLKGNITFENLVHFNDINVTGCIDGFPLKFLEKDIVLKRNHIFLSGAKNFSIINVTKNMKARSLNNHLVQDIVTLKGDQSMNGLVIIKGNVFVRGNITSDGGINDVPIVDLLKRFSMQFNSYVFSGDLKLKSDAVVVDDLLVGGNIQNKSFGSVINDAILKDDDLYVIGKKSFKGEVKFKENIIIEEKLNDFNLQQFLDEVVFVNKPEKLGGTIKIKEAVLKELETLDSFNSTLVNNFDVGEWFEDSIPLDKSETVRGKKIFETVTVLDDIKVNFINGHIPHSTISLKEKQHIPTLALVPKISVLSDLQVSGFVNGKDLMKEYLDSILSLGNQTIDEKTSFTKNFIVNGSLLINTIKGKKVDDLITLDTNQNIKTVLNVLGSVTAQKGVENLKVVNNITLDEWYQKSVLLNKKQQLKGSWIVHGEVKTKNIEGEGLLDSTCIKNVSEGVLKMRDKALEIIEETENEFEARCKTIKGLSQQLSHLPYLFNQFEIMYDIETILVIDSVIPLKIDNENYLIVTFVNECFSSLYHWNNSNSRFFNIKKINIGSVKKWSVAYWNNSTYLITSSKKSTLSCEENLKEGNVWVFEKNAERCVHLLSTDGFVDIAVENNTSGTFYTLEEKGSVYRWYIANNSNISSELIVNLGQDNLRFIDFIITGGLAVTNGREIIQINSTEGQTIKTPLSFSNGKIVALPLNGKTLVALIIKDKIVVYENIFEDKIFSVIHTYKAGSILWFDYGFNKQAFLIISSHHKLIEVFEYKSVSGLVKKISIQMFSSRLQSVELPLEGSSRSNKFIIVIQKKKLVFLRAEMIGDYFQGNNNNLC